MLNRFQKNKHSLEMGLNNFFVTFVEVLEDRKNGSIHVEPNVTSGDYLNGFLLERGRRFFEKIESLHGHDPKSFLAFSIGVLIALFERSVGFYASLINVNAITNQASRQERKPSAVINLQLKSTELFRNPKGNRWSVTQIATEITSWTKRKQSIKLRAFISQPDRGISKSIGRSGWNQLISLFEMFVYPKKYDVIVVGAGHAGVEVCLGECPKWGARRFSSRSIAIRSGRCPVTLPSRFGQRTFGSRDRCIGRGDG